MSSARAREMQRASLKTALRRRKGFGKGRVSECCCVVIDVEELTGRRGRTMEDKFKKTMRHHRF